MDADRWRRLSRLYHEARARAGADREGFLDTACADDSSLRQELDALLGTDASHADTFLAALAPGAPPPDDDLRPGMKVGAYRIERLLGRGGMGTVYLAHDTTLHRPVALKVIESPGDREATRSRVLREARNAAALNHAGICTIHEVGDDGGRAFIAMEYVEGRTLRDRLDDGPLPPDEALLCGLQIADALAYAHAHGVVHRDLKAANAIVTEDGRLKLVDFGLARRTDPLLAGATTTASLVPAGTVAGTPYAMAPEQVRGEAADPRSDVWAFGVLLYEMVTGSVPFTGASVGEVFSAILAAAPRPLPDRVPAELRALIERCLQKDAARRYASGADLRADLDRCRARERVPGAAAVLRRPVVAVPIALALLALMAAGSWVAIDARRQRWARQSALPEIARLLGRDDTDGAFRLGTIAERYIQGDRQLADLQRHYTSTATITSVPSGADVYVKGYLNLDADWLHLGRTPIEDVRIPFGYLRWRALKEGLQPLERAGFALRSVELRLTAPEETPPGMVHVAGGPFEFREFPPVTLQDFWLDAYEVTNRQFKRFVDQGGYTNRRYWSQPFVKDGRILSWDEAMVLLRDSTGRPGPARWSLGTYPDGEDDFPVSGVSWYEAAAYAAFAGVRLPTVHHWLRAHATPQSSAILQLSNFSGERPAVVGRHAGLSPFGNYDMAGNVAEWCWNAVDTSAAGRYLLGGSWNDPAYRFPGPDVASPWDRSATNGFRTARYEPSPDGALEAAVALPVDDVAGREPVSDEVFETYRSFYSYERVPLEPRIEAVDESRLHWREEKITFNAAYGDGERVIAYLLIPRSAEPPYQTVVYFASGIARQSRSSADRDQELRFVDFLPRTGRAVLFLVYKGTYERHIGNPAIVPFWTRDLVMAFSRDFSRSIDYLQTRPDVDRENIGYFSFSNPIVPVLSAIDGRIKAGAHIGAGLPRLKMPAEFNPIHFAPRAKEPTLLIGGRYDFIGPVETSQLPLLRRLGAPDEHKRLALFDSGHVVYPGPEMMKEVLDWFDRYLGPVRLKSEDGATE
jgi:formylglycine-generating enzyme required for sulfatase activity/predicted Ser/Thr protein kinase